MRTSKKTDWTPEQVARLECLIDSGASAIRAAAALKRTIVSVQQRARVMGKPFPHRHAVKRARLVKEAEAVSRQ